MGGKQLDGMKSTFVHSLACIRVKGGDSECFRIYSSVGHGCIISPWLFKVFMDAVMKEVKMGMGRRGVRFQMGRK